MFNLIDIICFILILLCFIVFFLVSRYVSKKTNADLKTLEEERINNSLEYKYQIEKLIDELNNIINSKK